MKLFWCLLLIIGLSLFVSCQETEKERFTRMVNEWMGEEIKFPEHSVFTVQGKDTVDFVFRDADYKVVSYIDSTGCTGCKLQLLEWRAFMHDMDSISGNPVSFIFYYHPKDVNELIYNIRFEDFDYPVCIDEKDCFYKCNGFPKIFSLNTFLLNKQNKILAIGNPIIDVGVRKLYFEILNK